MFKINNITQFSVIVFAFFLFSGLQAQNSKESVETKLSSIQNPEDKVNYLNNMAEELANRDTVKAIKYLDFAIKISHENKLYSLLGDSHRYKGNIYFRFNQGNLMKTQYDRAYEYYNLADDSLGIAKISNNLGIYYQKWENDYSKAKIYYEKSLKYKEELNVDSKSLFTTYFNLGTVYKNLGLYSQSIEYLNRALGITESLNQPREIADIFSQISMVYLELENYKKSRLYLDKSFEINAQENFNIELAFNYIQKAKLYIAINQIDSAQLALKIPAKILSDSGEDLGLAKMYLVECEILKQKNEFTKIIEKALWAESIFKSSRSPIDLAKIHQLLGVAYHQIGDVSKSAIHINNSLEISEKYNFIELSELNYLYKSKNHFAVKDFQNAYEALEKHDRLKDELFALKKREISANLVQKATINSREMELSLLSKEKHEAEQARDKNMTVSNYLKLIIILVLIVLSLLFYLYYSNKRVNDNLEDLVEARTKELRESNQLLTNSKKNEEDVSRMKSDLLKNISESLKSPISEIQSLVDILLDENEDNIELYEQLELINASTNRLNSIIGSITELYNIEDKKKVVKQDILDINSLITQIVDRYRILADSRDLNLIYKNYGQEIKLTVDKNLINNAIDHLLKTLVDYATKGEIEIKVIQDEDFNEISIYCSHFNINKRIFRQDLSTNNSSIDSGNKQLDRMFISLFVTKKIIEKINGAIRWESANKDEGIRFIMSFKTELVE